MIGLVIVSHGQLGKELLHTAEFILGRIENSVTISIDSQESPESIRQEIQQAIKKTDKGHGVIILTDMFGGTPSNMSLSFLQSGKVEVLTGVNLPMIIKFANGRDNNDLTGLANTIGDYGRKSINVAGEILGKKPKS